LAVWSDIKISELTRDTSEPSQEQKQTARAGGPNASLHMVVGQKVSVQTENELLLLNLQGRLLKGEN